MKPNTVVSIVVFVLFSTSIIVRSYYLRQSIFLYVYGYGYEVGWVMVVCGVDWVRVLLDDFKPLQAD